MKLVAAVAVVAVVASTAVAAPTTPEEAETANAAAFAAALAKGKLGPLALKQVLREPAPMLDAPAHTPGYVDLVVSAGWNAQAPEFVANAKREVFLVDRQPKVAAKLTIQLGCPTQHFAGGRAWTEHLRFAVPAGFTYKGTTKIAYATTQVVQVEATQQPDGKPCPEVPWMMD